ncbi:MAG: hypothetical protein M3P10_08950 [Actinomycetota bacterium]|nr:hypothetical protein [Actinomycetota bacterium]MDP9331604.1 hypothetical protein [Actinomycetota bacterium]
MLFSLLYMVLRVGVSVTDQEAHRCLALIQLEHRLRACWVTKVASGFRVAAVM